MTGRLTEFASHTEPSAGSADFRALELRLVESYSKVAKQYRRDDALEVNSENHRRLGGNLKRLSGSFGRDIQALDAGCGTGRYFHCLKNVHKLVGVDISSEMLQAATDPISKHEISVSDIQLLQDNIYTVVLPNGSFDLVYSLGMFGHGAPLTLEVCRKFYDLLCPGGRLYFNVLETPKSRPLARTKEWLKKSAYPLLPQGVRRKLEARASVLPCFTMTLPRLEELMNASGFSDFALSINVCRTPLWQGIHLECMATKFGRR
ncbi:MAG: class I SAM-dependent methyltransferase [Opitutae bacterium]|nr:class I SAM-dependent methyltransferase [Opitutae bacterium]